MGTLRRRGCGVTSGMRFSSGLSGCSFPKALLGVVTSSWPKFGVIAVLGRVGSRYGVSVLVDAPDPFVGSGPCGACAGAQAATLRADVGASMEGAATAIIIASAAGSEACLALSSSGRAVSPF